MKVFIMTDLEGISGVDSSFAWDNSTREYADACGRLMGDLNAAVQGALDAGADEVTVYDGHGGGSNFIKGALHPRAVQAFDFNDPRVFDGCGAYMEVGLHAKAGTADAFLDHTQSTGGWFDYTINGVSYGELIQGAAYCGAFGVPVVMASGDEAACREAAGLIEGIACAPVKRALGRHKAVSVPREEAERRIYDAAYKGVKKSGQIRPFTIALPAEIRVTYCYTHLCEDALRHNPELSRVDGRTVSKTIARIEHYTDLLP